MQTLTVEITNNDALKVLQNLQEKRFIKIHSKPKVDSLVFPGKALTTEEFKEMIEIAEQCESISLKEAEASWERQKRQLLKLAK